jgi:ABC-type antimicrobial peptide transport system permease subunit
VLLTNLFKQFRTRGLQSALIVLAVALGVAVITAVAAFLEIGSASSREFAESVEGRKIQLVIKANDWQAFYQGDATIPALKVGSVEEEPVTFSMEDLEKARQAAPSVDYAYLEVFIGLISNKINVALIWAHGVTPEYFGANDIKLSEGNGFIRYDYEQQAMIALISPRLIKAADYLQSNVIGAEVEGYKVVGTFAEEDNLNVGPHMLVPYRPDPYQPLDTLNFVVKDRSKLQEAKEQLETYARNTWGERVVVRSKNSYSLDVQARAASFIVAILASVGLVIAGLNIMNLMTARVLEQQKNIGVLRSIGASRADIRNRYLLDSLTLGVIGGFIGLVFGWLLVLVFNRYIQLASSEAARTLQIQLSPRAFIIGFVMACLLSTLFALYPARLAARTNIITSLKEL